MISAILFDCLPEEQEVLTFLVKDIIADRSNDASKILVCNSREELMDRAGQTELLDFTCLDICFQKGVEVARDMRKRFPETRMLLIADLTIPPADYIRPAIMPTSLLLRPMTREDMRKTLEEFICSALGPDDGPGGDIFNLENKDGVTKIPYRNIYLFESGMKKIFVRLKTEEYDFYQTLDRLQVILPDYFIRCHKSYIVNRHKVVRYNGTDSVLILDDHTEVPVSRSYRSTIRERLK
ncbi:MAG: LytTR family transcriptional regulator DNA-binding domain-containing protein [Lachnospiraceae bacterium]|nr:LytTR family transcriptional regulator DNA-binding domain-containing protein [Lachnospiraceae bacterium]